MAAIVLLAHPRDNVGTALREIPAGEEFEIAGCNESPAGRARETIPVGHKVALRNIPAQGEVTKYGEVIGLATADIAAGSHVHVHNVKSRRVE